MCRTMRPKRCGVRATLNCGGVQTQAPAISLGVFDTIYTHEHVNLEHYSPQDALTLPGKAEHNALGREPNELYGRCEFMRRSKSAFKASAIPDATLRRLRVTPSYFFIVWRWCMWLYA